MQGWGKIIPPAPFRLGPGRSWPSPVLWAGPGLEENVFLGRDRPNPVWAEIGPQFWAEPGPVVWAGPALVFWAGSGPEESFLGRDRPNTFWAEFGPPNLGLSPAQWFGPAQPDLIRTVRLYPIR